MDQNELRELARKGLQAEVARLNALLEQLTPKRSYTRRAAGGRQGILDAPSKNVKKRKRMSKEARRRISDMMKKRWAERRKKS